MFCRNCGNAVNEKAIACPKCGVNPKKEKNFCPSCGVATNVNQIMCTSCGVSLAGSALPSFDASALKNFDTSKLTGNKALIAAAIGIVTFFLPWVKFKASFMGLGGAQSYSGSGLSSVIDSGQISTILVPALLWLFPLALAALIASVFVEQLVPYKKILVLVALGLIVYAGIGIFTMKPKMGDMDGMMEGFASEVSKSFKVSAGIGFYLSLIAAGSTAWFSGVLGKQQ